MSDAIGLGLVQLVLDVIAREVGCNVGCYQASVNAGQSVQIDLFDEAWRGELPARALFKAIGAAVEVHTKLPLVEMDKCANEGGTLTVRFYAAGRGFGMGMGF